VNGRIAQKAPDRAKVAWFGAFFLLFGLQALAAIERLLGKRILQMKRQEIRF
jgi:hypothetical protein